jgi:cobalt-zinc-cadmium efflux system outer membrane protein
MLKRFFGGALFLLILAGCVSFQSKPIDPVKTLSGFEARTLDNPELKGFMEKNLQKEINPFPPKSWDFTMLTLVALYYYPGIDVARSQWFVARAGITSAGSRPNPNLGTLFQYNTTPPIGISPWTLGLNFDVPVETAGKRGYRIARAEALSEAARLQIFNVTWLARSRVRQSLVNFYAVRQREGLLKKQFEIQETYTRMLEQRFSSNMIALPAVTDARIARDRTRLALDEAKRQEAEAYGNLAESLGLPARSLSGVDFDFDFITDLPKDLPGEEARRQALLNRPDILSSLAEYSASQSALQLEIAKQYPDIHLGPGYTWDEGENKWFIGLSLNLPIFNRNSGPIAEAEARRQQAAAGFTELQAHVINEIDRTLAGYSAARNTFETARDLLDAERVRQKTLQFRLRPGEASRFTLVSAEVSFISAELSHLDALVKAQQARGLLEDALRRPLDQTNPDAAAQESNPHHEQGSQP